MFLHSNPPRANYVDTQSPRTAPSPPYEQSLHDGEYHPYNPADVMPEVTQVPQVHQQVLSPQQIPVMPLQSQQQQQQEQVPQQSSQQQTPSPRKSMFEFISPFDHLSASTSSIKKKPVPQASGIAGINEDVGSWTAPDPKRQSVENLLEHLTRGQLPPQPQSLPMTYEAFDFSQPETRAPPPPLPPKPVATRAASPPPRSSPPKSHTQRIQGRVTESPASQAGGGPGLQQGGTRREKEGSPITRGNGRSKGSAQLKLPKNVSSPS